MKKIKAVVLKDATKLSNNEMKNIRGGDKIVDNIISSSVTCSAQCESGALKPYIELDCSHPSYKLTCVISRDEYDTTAICINEDGSQVGGGSAYIDSCGNPSPPLTR